MTGKDCGLKERAPMCGVPYHSCESYISRLVAKGYKIAVCEQTEDPAKAKGLVKRDVIRVITPGTVIEDGMLDEARNNYLAAVCLGKQCFGVCFADASTGEVNVTEIPEDDREKRLIDELMRFAPSEVLVGDFTAYSELKDYLTRFFPGTVTKRASECFDIQRSNELICKAFNVVSPENLKIAKDSVCVSALGAVIDYLFENGKSEKTALKSVEVYSGAKYMRLDMTAIRNLELCETMRSGAKKGSLLWVLDKTKTAMGKRLIRSWIVKPLLSITEISLRQNAVEELCSNAQIRMEIAEYMSGIRDIERIITKALYGTASPKDLLSLSATAHRFPYIKQLLSNSTSKMLKEIYSEIDECSDIADLIDISIDLEAPTVVKEGKIIKKGYSKEVDNLREILNGGSGLLAEIEAREKERTGIKTLRVRFNKVFGYYIEVTNSFLDKVPEDYIRKQTLVNAERYVTEELKDLESKVLSAKDRVIALEYEIFDGIRKKVADAAARFTLSAGALAKLDVLCSFSQVAIENNYARPLVNNSGVISIKAGRHPVVEKLIKTPFVSNDTVLDGGDNRCSIITGPNMAGKSTYMRQVALITIMTQIGSFVPATGAEIGIVDAVFTRVGASDDLASGQSTFMVEMSEVAEILKHATKNSLLILDEIGRGTSTYDGMSIAKAVLEYVVDKRRLGAKSLFATHYHELTNMESEFKGIKNYNIAVKKRGDEIIFLRRIIPGGA
ncbi:MAG: DNA mismatch repair protein MutS, partial [Clostridia bacterium]|nr:DNA mismatch repair protein MutS [Clostridia bacterium]